jgi:RHS repeat-associated protein
MTNTYLFKAFGEALISGTSMNPFRYLGRKGYYADIDVGLCYVRRRYLRPALGRWLSIDRLARLGQTENLYWYALNRPTILVDPTGGAAIAISFVAVVVLAVVVLAVFAYLLPNSPLQAAMEEVADLITETVTRITTAFTISAEIQCYCCCKILGSIWSTPVGLMAPQVCLARSTVFPLKEICACYVDGTCTTLLPTN